MPFRQERMISVLEDFSKIRQHMREFRENIFAIARGDCPEPAKSQLLTALRLYQVPISESFALEERHFKVNMKRNDRERLRQQVARNGGETRMARTNAPSHSSISFGKLGADPTGDSIGFLTGDILSDEILEKDPEARAELEREMAAAKAKYEAQNK